MFTRTLTSLALLFTLSATATAHFVFIVPESGGKARVVFSDSLQPDENVPIAKISATKLRLRNADGKSSSLAWTKGDHALKVEVPGTGSRVVYGVTDYGVIQKGKAKPFLLQYHPKAIVGAIPKDGGKLGDAVPVEIVPVVSAGKVVFEVLARGKPVADAEVNVILKSGNKKLTTDAKGRTEAIEVKGQCGVWVRHTEATTGKAGGKAYEEARHYATLVYDLASPRP